VRVGKDILIAAYTYLVGGDISTTATDIPVLQQGRTAKGIDVGDGTWLGTHVVGHGWIDDRVMHYWSGRRGRRRDS
jgi:hypothetical protein